VIWRGCDKGAKTAHGTADLRKEQQASRERPRYGYSAVARLFFRSMDRLAGKETTLAKAKLVEALAPIPYRAWRPTNTGA
jgi:hypothetical protein